MVVWFLVFGLSLFVFPRFFDHLAFRYEDPGTEPPWYFITTDFKAFLGALIGLILLIVALALASAAVRRSRYALFYVFMTLMFYGIKVGDGIAILANTQHLLDPETATTTWQTHLAYLHSPWKQYGFFIYLLALVFVVSWKRKQFGITR